MEDICKVGTGLFRELTNANKGLDKDGGSFETNDTLDDTVGWSEEGVVTVLDNLFCSIARGEGSVMCLPREGWLILEPGELESVSYTGKTLQIVCVNALL